MQVTRMMRVTRVLFLLLFATACRATRPQVTAPSYDVLITNAQIVERTHLSINSIKSYIRSCYRKINVDSRSRAVLWGVDHGMQLDRVRVLDPDIPGAR